MRARSIIVGALAAALVSSSGAVPASAHVTPTEPQSVRVSATAR